MPRPQPRPPAARGVLASTWSGRQGDVEGRERQPGAVVKSAADSRRLLTCAAATVSRPSANSLTKGTWCGDGCVVCGCVESHHSGKSSQAYRSSLAGQYGVRLGVSGDGTCPLARLSFCCTPSPFSRCFNSAMERGCQPNGSLADGCRGPGCGSCPSCWRQETRRSRR